MYGVEKIFIEAFDAIAGSFLQFRLRDIFDILLVTGVVYAVLMLVKETRAMQLIKGLGMLVVATFFSSLFELHALAWLLGEVLKVGALAIIIIFQPELRRGLEQIGRGKIFEKAGLVNRQLATSERVVDELIICMENLAARRVGALILIERGTGLADVASTGTRVEAIVSAALLENIFEPNTPLHDGAVIIREGIVLSAGCFLPLSENTGISRQLGTRHRAALGVSEVSDCLAFVVSEETGVISVAIQGKLTRYLDAKQIRTLLEAVYKAVDNVKKPRMSIFNLFKRNEKGEQDEKQ